MRFSELVNAWKGNAASWTRQAAADIATTLATVLRHMPERDDDGTPVGTWSADLALLRQAVRPILGTRSDRAWRDQALDSAQRSSLIEVASTIARDLDRAGAEWSGVVELEPNAYAWLEARVLAGLPMVALPVPGMMERDTTEPGTAIRTSNRAEVVSPVEGIVALVTPSDGDYPPQSVLIADPHNNLWHYLGGLQRVNVHAAQRVKMGEPVGESAGVTQWEVWTSPTRAGGGLEPIALLHGRTEPDEQLNPPAEAPAEPKPKPKPKPKHDQGELPITDDVPPIADAPGGAPSSSSSNDGLVLVALAGAGVGLYLYSRRRRR